MYPSKKIISPDDGEYTRKHLTVLRAMLILHRILESPPEERFPNEDQWVDFDDSNNSLNTGSFIYGEIIPDLESQLEMEGKVKNTCIACSQFSVDNFSNFKVDKRSEVYNIYAFESTHLIVFHAI